MRTSGPLLCLLSAAAFGAMAIFGKYAYDAGVGVGDLLLVRFAMAAAVLLPLAAATGALRGLARRAVLAALAMGAVGYATQAGLFFLALERMDASLLALVLYTYPAFVLVGAVAARAASGRRGGACSRSSPPPRAPCSCWPARAAARSTRSAWRWGSARRSPTRRTSSSATACSRARRRSRSPRWCAPARRSPSCSSRSPRAARSSPSRPQGWGWLAAIALVSTVGAVIAFFAGLERVGPSAAAILSTLEPVVTVGLAAAAFGESLAGRAAARRGARAERGRGDAAAGARAAPRLQARPSRRCDVNGGGVGRRVGRARQRRTRRRPPRPSDVVPAWASRTSEAAATRAGFRR